MNENTSDVRWGQDIVVSEPSGTETRSVGMLSITSEMVGRQLVQAGGGPLVRDWPIDLQGEGLVPTRLAAPNVVATVRYGSGASSFTRVVDLAALGNVMHVVASWLSVDFVVRSTGLPANGNIRLAAYASPGRPSRSRAMCTQSNATYVPGTIVQIPPFATSVLGFATRAGATNSLSWAWRYNAINRGVVTNPPANMVGQWDTARAIPQDVTGLVMLPVAADNFLSLGFEVDG